MSIEKMPGKWRTSDGETFLDLKKAEAHEESLLAFKRIIENKIGPYKDSELKLGAVARLTHLPTEAPWMSAYGACLIMVTDLRRNDQGAVEFQLADEHSKPYDDGAAWVTSERFYDEWPQ